jgi:hypothetical protein
MVPTMLNAKQQERVLSLIKAICTRVQEKEGYVNKTKLIKYLYLIDVEYYRNHEKTYTGFNWIFYDFGPWAHEYNKIYDAMSISDEFRITAGSDPKYDAYFIYSLSKEEFEPLFENVHDELLTRRIVDRWAVENLNTMLNYVYFKTEPMVDAKRNESLDFRKIHSLEPIPKFKLTKGIKTEEERKRIDNLIREKIEASKKEPSPGTATFTPPNYDDTYFSGVERMRHDDEY